MGGDDDGTSTSRGAADAAALRVERVTKKTAKEAAREDAGVPCALAQEAQACARPHSHLL